MSIIRVFIGLLKVLRRKFRNVFLFLLMLACSFIIVHDGKIMFVQHFDNTPILQFQGCKNVHFQMKKCDI